MSIWTDDKIKLLATLKAEGWSARQMADIIGTTRSAVLGKIDRLGEQIKDFLTGRPSGIPKPPPSAQEPGLRKSIWKRSPEPVLAAPIFHHVADADPPPPPAAADMPLTLLNLHSQSCKWPINDGRPEFYFCGKRRLEDSPYCREHTGKAYNRKSNAMERQT